MPVMTWLVKKWITRSSHSLGLSFFNNIYCQIKNEGWDLGLCDLFHPTNCQHHQPDIGDNHAGYIGFRNNVTKMLVDDGAMNIVVSDWRNDG